MDVGLFYMHNITDWADILHEPDASIHILSVPVDHLYRGCIPRFRELLTLA